MIRPHRCNDRVEDLTLVTPGGVLLLCSCCATRRSTAGPPPLPPPFVLIQALFYAWSTPSPFAAISQTAKMTWRCLRSDDGRVPLLLLALLGNEPSCSPCLLHFLPVCRQEPTEPFQFLNEEAYKRRIRRAIEVRRLP